MTGTSMDGMDCCVADIQLTKESADFHIMWMDTITYPPQLKHQFQKALDGNTARISDLHFEFGQWMADSLASHMPKNMIPEVIGCHGQTIYHHHNYSTLQIGEPSYLAETFSVPVISDFRSRDVSVGGCGAPLIPIVDKWLLQEEEEDRIALNLGGIANVTVLPKSNGKIIGFDTGPGMGLLDERYHDIYDSGIDINGKIALLGAADNQLVHQWMQDSFIQQIPPKSAGRHDYGKNWILSHLHDLGNLNKEDQLATLSRFTAQSVYQGCIPYLTNAQETVIVAGGGSHHQCVMNELKRCFSKHKVTISDEFGIPVDGKEALGFAFLAVAYIKGIPANIPDVTGAKRQVVLGKLTI